MKKKRWIWIMLIVVIVGGGGYFLYARGRQQKVNAQAAENGSQEVAVVERGTLRITVDGGGSLAAQEEVAVSFEVGGKVTDVLVDVGDVVQAGDVLARLSDTDALENVADMELQVQQAEVSLQSTQLTLDELLEWEPDESAVKLAQANLEAAQADYERTVAQSSRTYDQLTSVRVNLEQAQEALDDAQETYNDAWDPARDWELQMPHLKDRLESDREAAEDNLERAQDDLEVAQANYNLEAAGVSDSSVKSAHSQVVNAEVALENEQTGPEDEEIESAQIQVEQAELSLEQAKLKLTSAQRALAETELIAPVGGTVTELNVQMGEMANAGQTAAILADLETLVVEIGLDESDIAQVSPNQEALVILDAFDDVELRGTITHIAPTAQTQSGVVLYDVTIALDPSGLPVRVGMTADVEIITSSAENVLLAPLKAVRSVGERTFVLRKLREGESAPQPGQGETGRQSQMPLGGLPAGDTQPQGQLAKMMQQMAEAGFVPVPVQLGMVTDAYAEVVSGLEEGDVVSTASASSITGADDNDAPRFPGMGPMGGGPR